MRSVAIDDDLVTETVVDIVGFPVHSLHLFCEGSASPYAAVKACTQRPESLRPALR